MNSYYQYNQYRNGGNSNRQNYKFKDEYTLYSSNNNYHNDYDYHYDYDYTGNYDYNHFIKSNNTNERKIKNSHNNKNNFKNNIIDNFPKSTTNNNRKRFNDLKFNNQNKHKDIMYVQYNNDYQYFENNYDININKSDGFKKTNYSKNGKLNNNSKLINSRYDTKLIKSNKNNNNDNNGNNSDYEDIEAFQDNLKSQNQSLSQSLNQSFNTKTYESKPLLSNILIDICYEKDSFDNKTNKTNKNIRLVEYECKDKNNQYEIAKITDAVKDINIYEIYNDDNLNSVNIIKDKRDLETLEKNNSASKNENTEIKTKKLSDFFSPNYKENITIINDKIIKEIEEKNEVDLNDIMINFSQNVEMYNRLRYNSMFNQQDNNNLFNLQNFYKNLQEEEIINYNESSLLNKSPEENRDINKDIFCFSDNLGINSNIIETKLYGNNECKSTKQIVLENNSYTSNNNFKKNLEEENVECYFPFENYYINKHSKNKNSKSDLKSSITNKENKNHLNRTIIKNINQLLIENNTKFEQNILNSLSKQIYISKPINEILESIPSIDYTTNNTTNLNDSSLMNNLVRFNNIRNH